LNRVGVGIDDIDVNLLQHKRIIGSTEFQRGSRIAAFVRAATNQSR